MGWTGLVAREATDAAWGVVGAIRRLQAAGQQPVRGGEPLLVLVAEAAFKLGASFALRHLAGELDENNLVKELTGKSFPRGLPEVSPCLTRCVDQSGVYSHGIRRSTAADTETTWRPESEEQAAR